MDITKRKDTLKIARGLKADAIYLNMYELGYATDTDELIIRTPDGIVTLGGDASKIIDHMDLGSETYKHRASQIIESDDKRFYTPEDIQKLSAISAKLQTILDSTIPQLQSSDRSLSDSLVSLKSSVDTFKDSVTNSFRTVNTKIDEVKSSANTNASTISSLSKKISSLESTISDLSRKRVQTLWTGDQYASGAILTLSDSINNYDELLITVNTDGTRNLVADPSSGTLILNTFNLADDETTDYWMYEILLDPISDRSYKIRHSKRLKNGKEVIMSPASARVTKIRGVKY